MVYTAPGEPTGTFFLSYAERQNAERPYSGHGGFGIDTAGRSFSTVENEDYSETKLLELTEDGFEQLADVEGLLDGVIRVR